MAAGLFLLLAACEAPVTLEPLVAADQAETLPEGLWSITFPCELVQPRATTAPCEDLPGQFTVAGNTIIPREQDGKPREASGLTIFALAAGEPVIVQYVNPGPANRPDLKMDFYRYLALDILERNADGGIAVAKMRAIPCRVAPRREHPDGTVEEPPLLPGMTIEHGMVCIPSGLDALRVAARNGPQQQSATIRYMGAATQP